MTLYDIPRDIWVYKVNSYLSKSDLLSLRQVNREFNIIFTSDEIWIRLIFQEWFQYDNVKMPKINNSFQYYIERKSRDKDFLASLHSNDVAKVINDITKYGDSFIPCLLKVRKANRLQNLSMIYRASQLIVFVKYCKIYDLMFQVVVNGENDYEKVLLTMNRVDPYFFEMITQRNHIRNRVISVYQSLIFNRNHIDLIKFNKSTASVILIIKIFNKLVKSTFFKNYGGLNEEFLIFPYYSGFKTMGIGYLSIICSICQELGLDVTITKELLIKIKDPNYKEGYSFLFIQRKVEIFNVDRMRKMFRYQATEVGKTMTGVDLLSIYFNLALNSKLSEAFINDVKFLDAIFKALLYKKNNNNDNDDESMRHIEKTLSTRYPLHILKLADILQLNSKTNITNQLIMTNNLTSNFIANYHFYQEYRRSTSSTAHYCKTQFQIGDLVHSKRYEESYIVLGYKNQLVAYTSEYKVYYLLMRVDGQFEIADEDGLECNEYDEKLLLKFSRHDKLGIFFDHYDTKIQKFILSKELIDLYSVQQT